MLIVVVVVVVVVVVFFVDKWPGRLLWIISSSSSSTALERMERIVCFSAMVRLLARNTWMTSAESLTDRVPVVVVVGGGDDDDDDDAGGTQTRKVGNEESRMINNPAMTSETIRTWSGDCIIIIRYSTY